MTGLWTKDSFTIGPWQLVFKNGTIELDYLISIDVANLKNAIEFYREAVALRLERRLFGGTVAEMLRVCVGPCNHNERPVRSRTVFSAVESKWLR